MHWFTASPSPCISVFKPFNFKWKQDALTLSVSSKPGEPHMYVDSVGSFSMMLAINQCFHLQNLKSFYALSTNYICYRLWKMCDQANMFKDDLVGLDQKMENEKLCFEGAVQEELLIRQS